MEFYNSFETSRELIEWMNARPKGSCVIREVEGKRDVVVVIPTADINSDYARYCATQLFKGLHLIFVESGRCNRFFNYSHNCNTGLKVAMSYSPQWIVVSNDDMHKQDSAEVLVHQLSRVPSNSMVVYTAPGRYHSYTVRLGEPKALRNLVWQVRCKYLAAKVRLEKKFGLRLTVYSNKFSLFYRERMEFLNGGSFWIFNPKFVEEMDPVFDETFINGMEDVWLSWRISQAGIQRAFIDYRIGDLVGGTMGGFRYRRLLTDLANQIYFNEKLKQESGEE